MNKRFYERVHTSLDVKLICDRKVHSGVVTNISRNGMCINSDLPNPSEMKSCEVMIHWHKEVMKVPVKVLRVIRSDETSEGMGVELIQSPKKYLEFVDTLHFFYSLA